MNEKGEGKGMNKKYKILIADDDNDLVTVLKYLLNSEGFETCVAHEGVRTLEVARKEKPDLILLDLKMPMGNGKSVLKALQCCWDGEKFPVIVVTGMEEENLENETRMAGAEGFLHKPFEKEILLKKIRNILAPQEGAAPFFDL
jgi:two-component system alkaline phosphatase synthesis response regulator PhoP